MESNDSDCLIVQIKITDLDTNEAFCANTCGIGYAEEKVKMTVRTTRVHSVPGLAAWTQAPSRYHVPALLGLRI